MTFDELHQPSQYMNQLLVSKLRAQRAHVLGILDGMTDTDLRRPLLPSGWTCLGLVQHLALDVELVWFGAAMLGNPEALASIRTGDAAWQVSETTSADAVFNTYRAAAEQSDAVLASLPLDARPRWWFESVETIPFPTLVDIALHVITETAVHAGHLDAVRELIDGRSWLIMT